MSTTYFGLKPPVTAIFATTSIDTVGIQLWMDHNLVGSLIIPSHLIAETMLLFADRKDPVARRTGIGQGRVQTSLLRKASNYEQVISESGEMFRVWDILDE